MPILDLGFYGHSESITEWYCVILNVGLTVLIFMQLFPIKTKAKKKGNIGLTVNMYS